MALLTDTVQIKIEPYNMQNGNVTTLRITKTWLAGSTHPDDEYLEINPIPFSELGRISETLERHYKARAIVGELKDQYDVLKEECRRTLQDMKAIIKQPSIEETAERLRLEIEQSIKDEEERMKLIKKPPTKEKRIIFSEEHTHAETPEPEVHAPQQPPEPLILTPRQQAESIYDKVLESLKGKSVEEQDIMGAVLKADVPSNDVPQVTKEIIELLKEKGAIDTPRRKLKRLFGGGKEKEKKT